MTRFKFQKMMVLFLMLGILCLDCPKLHAAGKENDSREKQSITLQYYKESEINDATSPREKNVVKYSIVLLNSDGTVSYELPKGVVVPDSYTYQTKELSMSASTFSQMGLSIPGYTLDDGWAFFWWTGNYSGSMYRVGSFRNFGGYSDAYPGYHSNLGFLGFYGNNPGGTGDRSAYESYVNTRFEQESKGKDYVRTYENSTGYYAYNPTGTLRVVFKQVSYNTTYKANFVDAFGENQQASNFVQVDQNSLQMHQVEGSWNQSTNTYQWYGTLAKVTEKVPASELHPNYEFTGWYMEMDAYGNGTGAKIANLEDDLRQHQQDVTYYAGWKYIEPEKPEPPEELPETGGMGNWIYLAGGGLMVLALFFKRKGEII